jgi:hypothetical protein
MSRTNMLPTDISPRFSLLGNECQSTEHINVVVLAGGVMALFGSWGYGHAPVPPVGRCVDARVRPAINARLLTKWKAATTSTGSNARRERLREKKIRNQIAHYRLSKPEAYALFKESTCRSWGTMTQTTKPLSYEDVKEMKNAEADEFLDGVYQLDELGETQLATFRVFDQIESLLHEGAFTVCDTLLERIVVRRLSTSLMRSFLTITFPAKDKLPSRAKLLGQIQSEMTRIRGAEITRRLLSKLV